jgi:hypothetical protein
MWTVVTGRQAPTKSCHWAAAPGEPAGELAVADRHHHKGVATIGPAFGRVWPLSLSASRHAVHCAVKMASLNVPWATASSLSSEFEQVPRATVKVPPTRTLESRRSLRSLIPLVS